jgi:phosphoserine phosphatase
MLRVYFVRHGETDWNIAGRLQGMTDTELNARGLAQAGLLAERLAQESDFVGLYTSPLRRAHRTGEIIGGRIGLPPTVDVRLVERNMGALEGLTDADVKAQFPDFHRSWRAGEKRVPFPGEEPREAFQQRIASFLQDVRTRHRQHQVVVITHGGAMGMIMATVMQLDLERRYPFWFDNASLNIVEFGGAVPRVLALNDTCHLRTGFPHPDEKQELAMDDKLDGGEARSTLQSGAL